MGEEKYPVCEHRNVRQAFERFYGADSGAWVDSSSSGIGSATTSVIRFAIRPIRAILEMTRPTSS